MIVMYGGSPPHLLPNANAPYYVTQTTATDRPTSYVLWPIAIPPHLLPQQLQVQQQPPPPPPPQQVSTLSAAEAMCNLTTHDAPRHTIQTPQPIRATHYDAITLRSFSHPLMTPTSVPAAQTPSQRRPDLLVVPPASGGLSDSGLLISHDSSRYTSPAVSPSSHAVSARNSAQQQAAVAPFALQYAASAPPSVMPSPVGPRRSMTRDSTENTALFNFVRHFFATHADELQDKSTQQLILLLEADLARAQSAGEIANTASADEETVFSHKLLQRAARSLGYTLTLTRGLVDNRIETSTTMMTESVMSSSSTAELPMPRRSSLPSHSYTDNEVSPGNVRVPLYDTVRRHKISGFACPKRKNLMKYLSRHPHCILYNAERDGHLLIDQQQTRTRRRRAATASINNMTTSAASTAAMTTTTTTTSSSSVVTMASSSSSSV